MFIELIMEKQDPSILSVMFYFRQNSCRHFHKPATQIRNEFFFNMISLLVGINGDELLSDKVGEYSQLREIAI